MFDQHGVAVARWGQGVISYDEQPDPVPAVYVSPGDLEVGDYRLSLDVAERFAERILTAVRWQRTRAGESR